MTGLFKNELGFPEARLNYPWRVSVTMTLCHILSFWTAADYLTDRRTGLVSGFSVCQVCSCPRGPRASLLGPPVPITKTIGLYWWHQLSVASVWGIQTEAHIADFCTECLLSHFGHRGSSYVKGCDITSPVWRGAGYQLLLAGLCSSVTHTDELGKLGWGCSGRSGWLCPVLAVHGQCYTDPVAL